MCGPVDDSPGACRPAGGTATGLDHRHHERMVAGTQTTRRSSGRPVRRTTPRRTSGGEGAPRHRL